MKTLIVEDDLTGRLLLQGFLKDYGSCHVAVNGKEAIEAVRVSFEMGKPYDLVCLDIIMPGLDGHEVLHQIRDLEEQKGILSTNGMKIIMTTGLSDPKNAMSAFGALCDAYVVKPFDKVKLIEELKQLKLIK